MMEGGGSEYSKHSISAKMRFDNLFVVPFLDYCIFLQLLLFFQNWVD